jgi:NTP pyrophosphatase (non-canonical NTP hydrolase)
MDLSTLQRERNHWISHNFPHDELEDSIMGAVEEIGELAHHYLKRKQGIRGEGGFHTDQMIDAVGDCVVFLAGVCTHLGVDYGEVVTEVWSGVKERDWIKDPMKGVS